MTGESKTPDGSGSLPSLDGGAQLVAQRYEVLGLLGVGGMGAVYKVRDRELDEVVALKMLRRELAESGDALERFRREVKLARRVTHPNVARTYDVGEHGGDRFLTMELVVGESLASVLARERRLSVARVAELVGPICAGLGAAHAAGVVHRDLKPDNVLVAKDGRVVITDFGVARLEEADAAQRTAVPVGTPAYMAPEQVEASPNIDHRADIYALGAMMFELLTGHLPWEGASIYAVAAMRLTQPAPDPRKHKPDLPEAVALLIMRCMARHPDDRPQTAEEIATRFASLTLPASDGVSITPPRITPRADQPGITAPNQKTVAVLPFRNAGAPEDEYLVDGLTDDLIDALSMTPGLRVRPRGVVMQLKQNASSDPRELGRELSVQVVVEGTVRSSADKIRVSARVLSVEDGFQLWAKRFEGSRADVLRIGDEAARAIAEALAVRKPTRALLTDPEAVDLYLRGRHEYMKFWAHANERAIELLKQAHARAPEDPLIMAAYAAALARQFGVTEVAGRQATARAAAEKAIELAPQLAEAHVALATVHLHDVKHLQAAREVQRALALSPLLADAHEFRARLLVEVGEPREAVSEARRSIQLEPRTVQLRYNVIWRALALLGEWDEVEKELAVPPEDADLASLYWLCVMRKLQWTGDAAGAAKMLVQVEGIKFSSRFLVVAASNMLITKQLGEVERGFIRERSRAPDSTPRMRSFWNQLGAEMLCYVGDHAGALDEVATAVKLGLLDVSWMDGCPVLERLRTHPTFRELRREVAARAEPVARELTGR